MMPDLINMNARGFDGLPVLTSAYKSAIRTLDHLGYTYHGGEMWKPPLGDAATIFEQEKRMFDFAQQRARARKEDERK